MFIFEKGFDGIETCSHNPITSRAQKNEKKRRTKKPKKPKKTKKKRRTKKTEKNRKKPKKTENALTPTKGQQFIQRNLFCY
jgi:hypothetical protein